MGGYRSVPSSPVKVAAGGSKLRPGASSATPTSLVGGGAGLNRAGSVKEYRRYYDGAESASPASPSPEAGSRSALIGHDAVFGGGRSGTVLASSGVHTNRAEKEEIERLNAVINSQRAIMADLEKSVASWKTRMKAQAELIQKLVVQNNADAGGSGGQSPPTSDAETEAETYSSPRRKLADSGYGENFHHTLPRTTHLSLAPPPPSHTASSEPYYGAHTYNRPPPAVGLGMLPSSPHKGFSANHTWSASSPSPLPLPEAGFPSPSRRKPRKTIEMDLKLLKSSPRVESNKSKFSLDPFASASQDSPTKRRGTNASAYYI